MRKRRPPSARRGVYAKHLIGVQARTERSPGFAVIVGHQNRFGCVREPGQDAARTRPIERQRENLTVKESSIRILKVFSVVFAREHTKNRFMSSNLRRQI